MAKLKLSLQCRSHSGLTGGVGLDIMCENNRDGMGTSSPHYAEWVNAVEMIADKYRDSMFHPEHGNHQARALVADLVNAAKAHGVTISDVAEDIPAIRISSIDGQDAKRIKTVAINLDSDDTNPLITLTHSQMTLPRPQRVTEDAVLGESLPTSRSFSFSAGRSMALA